MTDTTPKPSGVNAGQILKEIRSGTAQQQREILNELQRGQGGLGIDGATKLLLYLQDHVPCLDEDQRLALLTGKNLGFSTASMAMEIRDRLQSWWLKAEDRQAVDTVLQLLQVHANLPRPSVRLLKKVRDWVEAELIRQKLPRLQTLAWAKDVVVRRAAESGLELDIDVEVSTLANQALEKYRQAVTDCDPLVYGELTVGETRTWLACSKAVINGKAGQAFTLSGRPMNSFQIEQQVVKLFQSCRRWGVEGPIALEKAMNQRLQRWGGNPNELIKDQSGQWRWGDGAPAIKEVVTAYRRVMTDEGPRDLPVGETERFTRRGEGYASLFRDYDMIEIMKEIERAEAVAGK